MKKPFGTVFLCAVTVAALWCGTLFGASYEMRPFRSIADVWDDIVDVTASRGYIREKWPLVRGIFEMLFRFFGLNE